MLVFQSIQFPKIIHVCGLLLDYKPEGVGGIIPYTLPTRSKILSLAFFRKHPNTDMSM